MSLKTMRDGFTAAQRRVFDYLRSHGGEVKNYILSREAGLRYGARIWEMQDALEKNGYEISVKRETAGVCTYRLRRR